MAQWLLCPNWQGQYRSYRDDIGRVTEQRFVVTFVRVTNPTDHDGRFSMILHEELGDRSFRETEYNSGTWYVPPMYQHDFLIDPGRYWGDRFSTGGWIDLWLSLDAMLIDVSILTLTRNMIAGGSDISAGGFVESRASQTATLKRVTPPFIDRIIEWIMPTPPVPRRFRRSEAIIQLEREFDEPRDPEMEGE